MKKKLFLLLVGVCLAAVPAAAQDEYPRFEAFGGYSYLRTNEIFDKSIPKGWNASLAGNFHRNFGVEADFSGHYGSELGFNHSNHLFLFGPKVAARFDKVTPWAHALFGASHIRASGLTSSPLFPLTERRASDTAFAWALGGGLDADVHKNVAIRVVQADYIRINASASLIQSGTLGTLISIIPNNSNNLRLSFGVVFKWGGE